MDRFSILKGLEPPVEVKPFNEIIDIDEDVYHSVKIGTQEWMVENLKTTRFNDGTEIPHIIDNDIWSKLETPGFCWYGNDEKNKNIYGALYNWYAVGTGKLAPAGWRVPSDEEWNIGATNETGFSAFPGGSRYFNGSFGGIGYYGNWWSATASDAANSWYRGMYYNSANVNRDYYNVQNGFSVRCVKD